MPVIQETLDDFYSQGFDAGYRGDSNKPPHSAFEAGEQAIEDWLNGFEDGRSQSDADVMDDLW